MDYVHYTPKQVFQICEHVNMSRWEQQNDMKSSLPERTKAGKSLKWRKHVGKFLVGTLVIGHVRKEGMIKAQSLMQNTISTINCTHWFELADVST